jgi:TPR repeat protein
VDGGQTGGEDSFRCAEKSAAQGEREDLFQLGYCCRYGIACGVDVERIKENYLIAADLGDVFAMEQFGELLDKDDPQRFVWFGRAASNRNPDSF